MNNSSVVHSKGIGLILRNGATGILNTVEISANKDEGIHVEGDGTRMWANHLSANFNNNAGMEITQNAKAFINDIMMASNIKIGLLISDAAKVNLQYSDIRNTKLDSTNLWGYNLFVKDDAVLEMFSFDLSGATVAMVFKDAFATLSLGTVQYNQVALHVVNSTHPNFYFYDCFRYDISFLNNTARTGTGSLPLPPLSTGDEIHDDAWMNQKGCPRVPVESY
jgi:hypothetical protein